MEPKEKALALYKTYEKAEVTCLNKLIELVKEKL